MHLIEYIASGVEFRTPGFEQRADGAAPLLLLGSDDIQGAHPHYRLFQCECKRLGRCEGYTKAIKRSRSRSHRHTINISHGLATFSQQTLNVTQQLYTMVVARIPGIFAMQRV